MEPTSAQSFFDKWRGLDIPHKLGLASLLLILVAFPVAIILTLRPVNPFSKADLPVTPPGGNNPATISFVPSNLTVAPNENFSVAVQLNTGDYAATGADIIVSYDTSKIQALDVLPGPFLQNILETPTIDESTSIGKVRFVVGVDQSNPKSGIGTIAIVNFKAKSIESTNSISIETGSRIAAISTTENVLGGSTPAQVIVQSAQATSLTLKVAFEGVNSPSGAIVLPQETVSVQLTPDASPSGTITRNVNFIPNSDGTYSGTLTGINFGSFNLKVKGPVNLRKNIGQVVLTQGENLEDITYASLISGDISGDDNNVDGYDYNLLVQDFGSKMPSIGSHADLNFDGVVDIFDHRLIVKNFGKIGD